MALEQETLSHKITSRERVRLALAHQEPDRVPTDFLATPEIWERLAAELDLGEADGSSEFFSVEREAVLRRLDIDCRVLSYDMFCNPPTAALQKGAVVDWWGSASRSTPCRMWRQRHPDGTFSDIWGIRTRLVQNAKAVYEELAAPPLSSVTSLAELKSYRWPEPDWWDFGRLPEAIRSLDGHGESHLRFRIGTVFEASWQLRGMQEFLTDLAVDPDIPLYVMDRLTEVHVENLRRVLELVGDRLDMVYFYDDVATQNSLMMSKTMWERVIRPRHRRLVELARAHGKAVMYHCDGAIYPLIPDLIEMGIDVLTPVQPDARGMAPQQLKDEFGTRLSFHGGIDIIKTLPQGTPDEVVAEVCDRVNVLGRDGGYILCSSHHIQPDTPVQNILAMYDPAIRCRSQN